MLTFQSPSREWKNILINFFCMKELNYKSPKDLLTFFTMVLDWGSKNGLFTKDTKNNVDAHKMCQNYLDSLRNGGPDIPYVARHYLAEKMNLKIILETDHTEIATVPIMLV
jgi:hypothetical protein